MDIKKEIIKSLLKENFQELCKNPLFEKRVEEEKSRSILGIANYLSTITDGHGIPDLGSRVTNIKNTEEEKIKNLEKSWKDESNAKDQFVVGFGCSKLFQNMARNGSPTAPKQPLTIFVKFLP